MLTVMGLNEYRRKAHSFSSFTIFDGQADVCNFAAFTIFEAMIGNVPNSQCLLYNFIAPVFGPYKSVVDVSLI